MASSGKEEMAQIEDPVEGAIDAIMNTNALELIPSENTTRDNAESSIDYLSEELARKALTDKGHDATEPYCDKETIDRLCHQLYPQLSLPRLMRCGNDMFAATYKYTLVKGNFSLHHAWRWRDKKIFGLKLDTRDLSVVKWDQYVRSKLEGVDVPRVVHAERQDNHCLTVFEPLNASLKCYMRYLVKSAKSAKQYYGMLLHTGRQCVRYLKRIHDRGFLHGNINPHTFVFATKLLTEVGRTDLDRGPLIADFGHAINWREDPLYRDEEPGKHINNSLKATDGGMYTRRDDLENLGYVLLFLSKGSLRWETRKERDLVMFNKKCLSDLHKYVKGIPLRIKEFLTYTRILRWNEPPDYRLLDEILSDKKLNLREEMKVYRARRTAERLRLKREKRAEERNALELAKLNREEPEGLLPTINLPSPNIFEEDGYSFDNSDLPMIVPNEANVRPSDGGSRTKRRSSNRSIPIIDPYSPLEGMTADDEDVDMIDIALQGAMEELQRQGEESNSEALWTSTEPGMGSDLKSWYKDDGYDSDQSMIDRIIREQRCLPPRVLLNDDEEEKKGEPKVEEMRSELEEFVSRKPEFLSGDGIAYEPWSESPEQIHPWEEVLEMARMPLCDDIPALDDPLPTDPQEIIAPSSLPDLFIDPNEANK